MQLKEGLYKTVFKSILVLVVLQLSLFNVATAFTTHHHQLANGRFIVHNHAIPITNQNDKNTPSNNHHHTELELFILYLFTNINFAVFVLIFIGFNLNIIKKKYEQLKEKLAFHYTYSIPSLRAPPL